MHAMSWPAIVAGSCSIFAAIAAAAAFVITIASATAQVAGARQERRAMIVPGVERLRGHAASTAAERGVVLLGELSCTACHVADDGYLQQRRAPDLTAVGARVTPT